MAYLDVQVVELHLHAAAAHLRDYVEHALQILDVLARDVQPLVLVGQPAGDYTRPLLSSN